MIAKIKATRKNIRRKANTINKDFEIILPDNYEKVELGPIKDKWLKALRSGRYPQGFGRLRTASGGYCCLGVLSKIQKRLADNNGTCFDGPYDHTARSPLSTCFLSDDNPVVGALGNNGAFPKGVSVKIIQPSNANNFSPLNICLSLTDCNDDGMSFKQLAEVIDIIWK